MTLPPSKGVYVIEHLIPGAENVKQTSYHTKMERERKEEIGIV